MHKVYYTDSFESPGSTAIYGAYYDEGNKELYIEFPNGRVAGYEGVEQSTFDAFKDSDSKGRFYNSYVYGNFRGVSGDVELISADEVASTLNHADTTLTANREFVITIQVVQKIKVSAPTLEDALRKVNDAAAETGAEQVVIKEATIVFD